MTNNPSLGANASSPEKAMLRVLAGEHLARPPIWIMRQAGRYLPEYREIRKQAKTFLDFCYAPALATEAVLQPLRRFDLDAAILFSDILVVPDALGRAVRFEEGEGPRLAPLVEEETWRFAAADAAIQRLGPVYEAVERIKAAIPSHTSLIGFAGAPWTVATYMLQGRGGDKDVARLAAYSRPEEVDALLALLADVTALHLAAQVKAGAECLQVFESWAEGLSPSLFQRLVMAPTQRLLEKLRAEGIDAPVIGFPRGAGHHLETYAALPLQGLGLDTSVPIAAVRAALTDRPGPRLALQGNLDPMLLIAGGAALDTGVREVLAAAGDAPHIFNLGHGITPLAAPEHVSRLVALVKESG
jgi:uroporphyrinogen decarboxylase